MTVLSDYVSRMVDGGMDVDEAMQIAAELFAAGVASAALRPSKGALRTKAWRERNRHQSVTSDDVRRDVDSVTKRHETSQIITCDNRPISLDKNNKKERRGTQLSDGWKPDDDRWMAACQKFGADGAKLELDKFTSHHRAKGTVFKNWNFGWDKWALNAGQWSPIKPISSQRMGVVDYATVDWRPILQSFKRFGTWPKGHGNEPGTPACRAPPDLLREFGYGGSP